MLVLSTISFYIVFFKKSEYFCGYSNRILTIILYLHVWLATLLITLIIAIFLLLISFIILFTIFKKLKDLHN